MYALRQGVDDWEDAAELILQQEEFIAKLEKFERLASDPNRFFEKGASRSNRCFKKYQCDD